MFHSTVFIPNVVRCCHQSFISFILYFKIYMVFFPFLKFWFMSILFSCHGQFPMRVKTARACVRPIKFEFDLEFELVRTRRRYFTPNAISNTLGGKETLDFFGTGVVVRSAHVSSCLISAEPEFCM